MAGKVLRLVVENDSCESQTDKEASTAGLSPQEALVLRLVASGVPTGEIANQLAINQPAVKEHIKGVLHKMRDRIRQRGSETAPGA
jgi:DNA-binding CsgD family transcriptional regulator